MCWTSRAKIPALRSASASSIAAVSRGRYAKKASSGDFPEQGDHLTEERIV